MKMLKKILFFFSLFLVYLIVKEFLTLYVQIKSLHPYAAYAFLVLVCFVLAYFVIIPVLKILALPRLFGPIRNREQIPAEISKRMQNFRNNAYLQSIDFDVSALPENQEGYDQVVRQLEKKAENLRKIHVSQMFYSTAIAQNGFLDALFILSGSINHIKEMFTLYHGRISNRELWVIARKIYYSMAIGGSEGVEYATEEIISKFASQGLKSIPFIDKILSSLADGLVNATLLTRISLITENYCKLIYIESDRELYPSVRFISDTARHITGDLMDRIFRTLKKLALRFALDKTFDFALIAMNPVGYVLGRSIEKSDKYDTEQKIRLKDHAKLMGNPLAYGLEKLMKSFRKR